MKKMMSTIAACVLLAAAGCVTPTEVKEASSRHTSNLSGLAQGVAAYKRSLGTYFDALLVLQRDAYVAQHVIVFVNETSASQAAALSPLPRKAADDFIDAGEKMAGEFEFWARNFDFWMNEVSGDTMEEKRKSLKALAERASSGGNEKLAQQLFAQADRSDEDLTYVYTAIELERQRELLLAQLTLLSAQVATMQEFHRKIDKFLAIDATIDGSKIAEAAAAGSSADVSGLLDGVGGGGR